jgi:hypothetical protein|tara:strand:- start:1653 stop:3140 length:1488 start_codon:yes stop_codon:yes gene_type:complete
MATREELLSLFGDDFDEVLKGLNALPVEVRQLLDRSLNNLVYDAEVFGQRINKVVQTQQARGITLSNIAGSLATDMQNKGRIFGELKNSIKSSLVEGVNQAGQAGSFAAYDPDENTVFTWITVAGHKICADCAPRGGQQATLREWEERGMPGSGWSVCQGYCYCILDPSGKLSPRLQFEEVQEQGATARPKPKPAPTPAPVPLPKPPPAKDIKWKPSMSKDKALKWSENSTIQGELFHGSSSEAINAISKKGFDFSKFSTGKLYGNGAYTTRRTDVASGFADKKTPKTGVFIANTKKTLDIQKENYWSFTQGKVKNPDSLTRGHRFVEKAKLNIHDLSKARKDYEMLMTTNPTRNAKTGKMISFEEFVAERKALANKRLKDSYTPPDPSYSVYSEGISFHEKLAGEWFDFIEDQFYLGNENAIQAMNSLGMGSQIDDLAFGVDGWANLINQFLKSKGYDSMIVRKANIGMSAEVDDYFVILTEKALTLIDTLSPT